MNVAELKEELTTLYKKNTAVIQKDTSGYINNYRSKALNDFSRLGIPTNKDEVYRYTDLTKYLSGDYTYDIMPSDLVVSKPSIFRCSVPELDNYLAMVINGFYYTGNKPVKLPHGVIVSSFAEASTKYPDIINKHYAKYADTSTDSLTALNTLFAQDGVFIYVPANVQLEKPIQVVNIGYSDKNLRVTRRNLIVAEEGSSSNILICDHTMSNKSFITNSLTEIYVGKNARLDYVKLQNENSYSSQISNTFIYQEEHSVLSSNILSLHGGLLRNNIYANLDGSGIENNTFGLFLADDNQHIAMYTNIKHAKPHSISNQLIKGILDENATGAFNGKIYVAEKAEKTLAYQRNNNILLSSSARMNSKPQLEIYNDDVKCSHGATVGQLDNNALFYLRSRGIGEHEARHLLMYAFANEVIGKITLEPLKERIIDMVDKRLRGELTKCANCELGTLN